MLSTEMTSACDFNFVNSGSNSILTKPLSLSLFLVDLLE